MKKITISLLFVFVLLPTFAFSQAPTIDPITIPEAGANISYRCVDVQPVDGDQGELCAGQSADRTGQGRS